MPNLTKAFRTILGLTLRTYETFTSNLWDLYFELYTPAMRGTGYVTPQGGAARGVRYASGWGSRGVRYASGGQPGYIRSGGAARGVRYASGWGSREYLRLRAAY
ncbi:hypothetical protein TNCT_219201 [Trichonephila clavata]|uniref:Uncharacterized protein n=1 Tax=Trichonephila clavata TaxID=2740835 RepID=A0A8X6HQI9_TRICU|nr:hypothetical protein TNCT_219201 [Trichonephila clavata]